MPGTHEPLDDIDLPSPQPDDRDDEQPAREADGREHRVAHRPNPLPAREEDEVELAEADLLHQLDLDEDDIDLDDFARTEDADL
jgi:hypothetical protein